MRNIKDYLLLFLFLAFFVPHCWALPDLYISQSDISFSTDCPKSGQEFTISATVHNSGTDYSERVIVKNTEEDEPELFQVDLSSDVWIAQSFQYTEDVNLKGVSLYIRDIGVDDSLAVTIETNLSTNVPSGNLVVADASTTVNSSGGFWYWKDFIFPGLIPLSGNTTYWIVTHNYATGASDGYSIVHTSYNYYASGIEVYSYDQGGTWEEWDKRDLLFKAYRSTTTIVRFFDDDPDLGGSLIGIDEISPVPASGGSVTAAISTSTSAGYHDIYVHINRDNYIVESDTTNNKSYDRIAVDFPRVISAETIDDDLDGRIDAYYIVFNEAVRDSDTQFNPAGFTVDGHSIIGVLTTLANHPDVLDDDDIYLCFTESGVPDTGSLPEVTYSSATGKLTDLDDGNLLLDIGPSDIMEIDGTSPAVYALLSFPQNHALGIPVDTSIQIIFAEQMNVATTTGAIKVEAIVNKDGETMTPEVLSGSFSSSYDGAKSQHEFSFQPVPPLENNHTYRVTVDTTATDLVGEHVGGLEFSFTTIANCKESNTFVSGSGKMRITLNAGTSKENFFVNISTAPLKDSSKRTKIIDANNKLEDDDDPFSFTLGPTVVEIEAFDANGNPITDTFDIPAIITLSYEDSNPADGIVDGTSPALREKTLAAYWLDESHNLWVKLAGSKVDTGSNRVSADTFHFSVFSLHGMGTTDLSDAYAYPVPFIPSRGDEDITFTNISPICTIKIYTLNGELVRSIEHTSGKTSYSWDVTNDGGDRLGSGVYLYLIDSNKSKKKGKLIVIR
ncbi:T9SS type A sorting domain-containing protein [bacterium]|nr:T9SS type A sorting domain-containing protein [bacterium]NIO18845.1 T9SS type A sorting domain-containing protein [bacterium]